MINGMFETDYPLDSTITYNWTEFEDDNLKRILADAILTINGCYAYHLEAQMEKDNSIVFRVFEYSFSHANRTRIEQDGVYQLRFPRPMVIYLYYEGTVPDEYELKLEFEEGQEMYTYKVPVLKLPEISTKELSDRKMVILIPFHILKLRYALQKGHIEDVGELQRYILGDIIGHINENMQLGNITMEDALKLKRYLHKLCDYLSAHYKELEGMPDMTDESFMTDIDIMCKEHEEAMEKLEARIRELEELLVKTEGGKDMTDESYMTDIDIMCKEHEETVEKLEARIRENEEAMAEKDARICELEELLKRERKVNS